MSRNNRTSTYIVRNLASLKFLALFFTTLSGQYSTGFDVNFDNNLYAHHWYRTKSYKKNELQHIKHSLHLNNSWLFFKHASIEFCWDHHVVIEALYAIQSY